MVIPVAWVNKGRDPQEDTLCMCLESVPLPLNLFLCLLDCRDWKPQRGGVVCHFPTGGPEKVVLLGLDMLRQLYAEICSFGSIVGIK